MTLQFTLDEKATKKDDLDSPNPKGYSNEGMGGVTPVNGFRPESNRG